MQDRELLEKIFESAFPRIKDLASLIYQRASLNQDHIDDCASLDLDPLEAVVLPLDEDTLAVVRTLWRSPVSTIAVSLLRVVARQADEGIFISNDTNVTSAIASIDHDDLVRKTGLERADIPFVLQQVADSLVEVIGQHSPIDVLINRQPIQLRSS